MTADRWTRLHGVLHVDELRAKRIVVVGLGSGGSTVALELAKSGIERFVLIDPDDLNDVNLIRHECDDRYLGWNKALAVGDLIRHRNPGAVIETVPQDVFKLGPLLDRVISEAHLVVVCTDSESSKHLINQSCTHLGVLAVYAGVYERAVGGEVISCRARQEDACFGCVMSILKDDQLPAPPMTLPDYGVDDGLRGAPGLGLDVRLVALVHAKVCLSALMDAEAIGGNVVLFGTAPVEGLFPRPLASAVLNIARQDGCLSCTPLRSGAFASNYGARDRI